MGIYLDSVTAQLPSGSQTIDVPDDPAQPWTITVPEGTSSLVMDFDAEDINGNIIEDFGMLYPAVPENPDNLLYFDLSFEPSEVLWGLFNNNEAGDMGTVRFTENDPGLDVGITNFVDITFIIGDASTAFSVTCFAAGTGIATPRGDRSVEHIRPGDPLMTADGRTIPVKWVGRQALHKLDPNADRFGLVRIQKGALGHGLPHKDLTLTGDHALMLDGYAINASALVNGTTIGWVPMSARPYHTMVYHIETEEHDVILANGVPAETFLDVPGRQVFDNYDEYLDLYGEETPIHEMPVPRISSARLLPSSIRTRLAIPDLV